MARPKKTHQEIFEAAIVKFPQHKDHACWNVEELLTSRSYMVACGCAERMSISEDEVEEFLQAFEVRAEIPKGYSATFTAHLSDEESKNLGAFLREIQDDELRLRAMAVVRAFPEHLHCAKLVPAHEVPEEACWYSHPDFDDPIMASMAGLLWHCCDCQATMMIRQSFVDEVRESRNKIRMDVIDQNIHTASGEALDHLGEKEGIIRHGGPAHGGLETDVDYRERILEVMAKPSRQVDLENAPKPEPAKLVSADAGVAALPDYKRETGAVVHCQGEEDGDI